jgi:hypothetical protein
MYVNIIVLIIISFYIKILRHIVQSPKDIIELLDAC